MLFRSIVKPLISKEYMEETDESAQLNALEAAAKAKDEQIVALESKVTELSNQITEAEELVKVQARIDEKVKGHRFEKQLRTRLEECKQVDQVDAIFDSEVEFIESLLGTETIPAGQGQLMEGNEDDTELDEQKARQKRLAGL